MFAADVFATFTLSFDVRSHHERLVVVRSWLVPDVAGAFVGPVRFDVGPNQSPDRVLAFQ